LLKLTVEKQRDDEEAAPFYLKRTVVDIGLRDADGAPITSLVLVPVTVWEKSTKLDFATARASALARLTPTARQMDAVLLAATPEAGLGYTDWLDRLHATQRAAAKK